VAHEVAIRNQACSGVVIWVSIDDRANVVTKVEGTFLGWNGIGINDEAANCVSFSIDLKHIVEKELEGPRTDAKTGNAWMALLDHVKEHFLGPAAAAKVGINEAKEQDQCRRGSLSLPLGMMKQ
jgi:hypothetical protein